MYFYQPSQGHGLPHDPLNAIIGPRPIGWISSCDRAGQLNLAPYLESGDVRSRTCHESNLGYASSRSG